MLPKLIDFCTYLGLNDYHPQESLARILRVIV